MRYPARVLASSCTRHSHPISFLPVRRPAAIAKTVLARLPGDVSANTAGATAGSTQKSKVLVVVTTDSNGFLSKQKISISGQSSLDRVLATRRSLGLIALNDPDTLPVAVGSLEELQYDREYMFAGDLATLNILKQNDENFGVSGNNGGHGGVASTLSEVDVLGDRLARLYPGSTPRPDLLLVAPGPHEPHHDAPLAAQHYEIALQLPAEWAAAGVAGSNGSSSSSSSEGSSSSSSNGNGAAAAANGNGNGKARKPVLILASYVTWLEGKRIDEAQKRIAALRRRATLPEEWPAYAKYSAFEVIALVLLAHKVAEGEEDLVECLTSHHGVRILLAEGNLDITPANYPLKSSA